ncbi:MAG: Crp/Fnr family transcriptional regulator [Bacilli bacterium]|nr:Crp/Fnr family transcriptional regulator [Bacilli bacterium]
MNRLLQTLTKEEIQNLKIVEVKKGDTLFFEDEICKNVGLVIKGEIRIVSFLEDGREIIYNVLADGEMFGNNLIFSSSPNYRGDVIAQEDSLLYLLSKEDLLSLLKTNNEFLEAYLWTQAESGKQMNLKIKLLTFINAEDRLLYYLQINHSKIRYKSISDLAKTLYLSREVLSRLIHKLEKDGVIYIRDKTIVKS